jgi:gamma-glutamylputrescine oxidase
LAALLHTEARAMAMRLVDTYYARTLTETRDFPPLDSDLQVETLVIGGGLAGCATALDLAERGHSVALIEGHRVGWGASGRNGGFATAGFPRGYQRLADRVGLPRAREFQRLAKRGQDLVRERITSYAIDCGPLQQGQLICNIEGVGDDLPVMCRYLAENFGIEYEHWPKERLREALVTERYSDAVYNPTTFAVHPLNLTRGLARAAAERRAKVFEVTPARKMSSGGGWEIVETGSGRIKAEQVVITCGGYIDGLEPTVSGGTIPIATFVMATEPLGNRLRTAIRVPYAISDNQIGVNYYRPLADGRILWGGRVLAWQPGNRRIATLLKRDMVRFYPSLDDAKVDVAWGGLMPFTRHKLPVIGKVGRNVWYTTGFGGLGVTLTSIVGHLIARGITEGDDTWRLFEALGLPFAGGRLGKVPAQLVYWTAKAKARLGLRTAH